MVFNQLNQPISRGIKIAHVVCTFPPYRGGMGNSAYHFARLAALSGNEVTVFTPAYKNKSATAGQAADKEFNFRIERLRSLLTLGNAAILPQLIWRLRGFDLVHFHYPFYGAVLPVLVAKWRNPKQRLIVHYHMDSIASGLKGLIFKLNRHWFLPPLLSNADFVTCASLDYAKHSQVAELYRKYETKFITMPFGVDLDKFSASATAEKHRSTDKIILFVANLDRAHRFKGLEVLFAALKLLLEDRAVKNKLTRLKLRVVGEGDLKAYYQEQAAKIGLSDAVEFTGGLSDRALAEAYGRAQVLTLPSINQGEAFGLVLLEAMACGTPVVASSLAGVRNVFKSGSEGLEARPGDARDLANKLKTILLDENLAMAMSRAARELVEKRYDWLQIGKNLNLLYHRAIYTPKNEDLFD